MAPPVLMYHGFARGPVAHDAHDLLVPADRFERQLRLLARWFNPLTLDDYAAGLERGRWRRRGVLVTIDDGYTSTLDIAAPLLAKYGVPAVVFIPAALVGGRSTWVDGMPDEPLLDADQLRAIRAYGIDVGVHSLDHTPMSGLAPGELRRQAVDSLDLLTEILGTRPRSFAYPCGVIDDAALAAVRDAGYTLAFSVTEARGRYAIPRRGVSPHDSTRSLLVKLTPPYGALRTLSARRPRLGRAARWVLGQEPRHHPGE